VRVAFFDVDETLIAVKSMFRFLRFHWRDTGRPDADYDRAYAELVARAASTTREHANREYYRLYTGEEVERLAHSGRRWFDTELAGGGFFVEEVVAELHRHRRLGDRTVLVSGSFPAPLQPIARHLGADAVLCSQPVIADGRCTGEITAPMIGAAKARAVRDYAASVGAAPVDCWAYGDHASDLDMLNAVGHPVVVGDDPVLSVEAARRDWSRIAPAARVGSRT
jgi:HAD superfamily hydrolase (TIGR01490 family)